MAETKKDTTPATPADTMPAASPAASLAAKSAVDAQAAVAGAQAVASAVTRVADEAVRSAQTAAAQVATTGGVPALDVSGIPGGPFTIRGAGFGTSGTVTFAGVQVKTTAWSNEKIKGELPPDVRSGAVVVDVDDGKAQHGTFRGSKAAA